jgi:FkbM family methyltransferase
MIKKKLVTYLRYLFEYAKHGDLLSILASAKYLLFYSSHPKDRLIKSSMGVFFCRKNTNDFQYANYAYEWGVKKYILDHQHEYSVFIDAGACIGEYSILLARKPMRCFAFEPVRESFDSLAKNLELNGLDSGIKAFPFGLGDRNGQVEFVFNSVNTGASHISTDSVPGNCAVEIRTFDSLLPEMDIKLEDHILFKLDVEGMEPDVLRGAKEFIQNFPHITFVMEDKHSGEGPIRETLEGMARFEFGTVDEFNIFAKKTN